MRAAFTSRAPITRS